MLHYTQGLHEQYDSTIKGLETACVERITSSLTNNDGRLIHPTHDDIDRCKLEDVKKAVPRIMTPEAVEVSEWVGQNYYDLNYTSSNTTLVQ